MTERKATEFVDTDASIEAIDVLVVTQAPPDADALVGRRFALAGLSAPVLVGARADNGVVLEARGVSNQHARLELRGESWWCIDADSRNGTFVNNRRLTDAFPIANGDRLRFGTVEVTCLSAKQQAPARSGGVEPLPFPIAIAEQNVDAQKSGIGRTTAAISSIEVGLRFVVACLLAWTRDNVEPAIVAQCLGHTQINRPLTMGALRNLAHHLAMLVPADAPASAVVDVARALATPKKGATALAKTLADVVNYRNHETMAHSLASDAAFEESPDLVMKTREQFVAALRPLGPTKLVTVAERDMLDDEDGFRYKLYVHRGPSELFPVETVNLLAKLRPQWSYLLLPESNAAPLCLAPMVAAVVPVGAGRMELMMASTIILGPKDALVDVKAVTSNRSFGLNVPAEPKLIALFEAHAKLPARG